eukprot:scaffold3243_cov173-Ochromonas_danica.AAC.40
MLHEVEKKQLVGCQLLDYFALFSSGLPILTQIINRILLRQRAVLVKQTFSWMVFGELTDSAHEFFIQASESHSSQQDSLDELIVNHAEEKGLSAPLLDWNNSFRLLLPLLPSSHMSASVASKVLFSGKAMLLLRQADRSETHEEKASSVPGSSSSSCLDYLSKGCLVVEDSNSNEGVGRWNFTADEVKQFDEAFEGALQSCDPQRSASCMIDNHRMVQLFEEVVNNIAEAASLRLWRLLQCQLDFYRYLFVCRNVFLLGRGEVVQGLLDELYILANRTAEQKVATKSVEEINHSLGQEILPKVMKMVGVVQEEEEIARLLLLSVSSHRVVLDRWDDLQRQQISLVGQAGYVYPHLSPPPPEGSSEAKARLATSYSLSQKVFHPIGVDLTAVQHVTPTEVNFHRGLQLLHIQGRDDEERVSYGEEDQPLSYLNGGLWLHEMKSVARGFRCKVAFTWPWASLQRWLTAKTLLRGAKECVLASIATCVHNDPRAGQTIGRGALNEGITSSLSISATLYVIADSRSHGTLSHEGISYWLATSHLLRIVYIYAIFVKIDEVLAEKTIVVRSINDNKDQEKVLNMVDSYLLEVDFTRQVRYQPQRSSSTSTAPSEASTVSLKGSVNYILRARLSHEQAENYGSRDASNADEIWDLQHSLETSELVMSSAAGFSYVGVVASSQLIDKQPLQGTTEDILEAEDQEEDVRLLDGSYYRSIVVFKTEIQKLVFESMASTSGTVLSHPVCSAFTSTHHPETYLALEAKLQHYRLFFTQLRVQVSFPPILSIVFDSDTCRQYERLFQLLIKVRSVAYGLEHLWMHGNKMQTDRSPSPFSSASISDPATDRKLCHIRHAMHFFVSNLLYYLQVDVMDSEFTRLLDDLKTCRDFQSALTNHRHFLANIVRLTWLDQLALQENIDRILHLCWRFVASYQLLVQSCGFGSTSADDVSSGKYNPPVIVPSQEFDNIIRDFFQQVQYLVHMMRSTETRGFLFRLDFNGYLSQFSITKGFKG